MMFDIAAFGVQHDTHLRRFGTLSIFFVFLGFFVSDTTGAPFAFLGRSIFMALIEGVTRRGSMVYHQDYHNGTQGDTTLEVEAR
jgi:hypothetical protein